MKKIVAAFLVMILGSFCWSSAFAAPESKEMLTDQCRKHTEKFEYPEAVEACNKAISLDAKYIDAYFWRGVAFVATRQYEKAIADFTQVISLNPNDVQALSNRGLVYRRLKQYDLALKDLNQAIELDPSHAAAWLSRGTVFAQMDQVGRCHSRLQQGDRTGPEELYGVSQSRHCIRTSGPKSRGNQ